MSYYIGIDIGTSGTKSLLVDSKGTILAEASAEYGVLMPKPMWTEQNPDDWWNATVKTVKAVLKISKVKGTEVKAIGLSGQMHGSVFLDAKQKVIRPALLWNDQRTAAECDEITRRAGGREKLIEMVANPALTGFTAPKVLWLRNHEKKNYDKLRHLLLPKDEIRRRLTGVLATEVSDASGMLLLDVVKRRWSKELLSKLELDESLLAKVHESEEVTGTLLPEVAKELGLSTHCKVVGGAGDCAAGAVGNGIVKQGILTTSLGTSAWCSSIATHHNMTSSDGCIRSVMRFGEMAHDGSDPLRCRFTSMVRAAPLQGTRIQKRADPYKIINEEAEKVASGSEGLFFLPYLAGERTPHADAHARGCFIGLTNAHDRGHMARSVMEGVAYSLRESLAIIRSLEIPIKEIRLSGGGPKSDLWKQILSDVFGQTTCTINAEQGPAYGVALLAAVGMVPSRISRKHARRPFRWFTKCRRKSRSPKSTTPDFPSIRDSTNT